MKGGALNDVKAIKIDKAYKILLCKLAVKKFIAGDAKAIDNLDYYLL